jgi:hypothetical protein
MSTETADDETSVEIDNSPTKISSYGAIVAAFVAALTSAPFALLALPLGLGGVGIVAAGVFLRYNRTWVTLGAASLFLSVIISGGFGAPVEFLLVSTIGTMLAWDLGQNAISLGEQMGRHTNTRRNEVIHASFNTVVAMLAMGVGYGIYSVASGGQPVAALTMLLFGSIFLVWAIRV